MDEFYSTKEEMQLVIKPVIPKIDIVKFWMDVYLQNSQKMYPEKYANHAVEHLLEFVKTYDTQNPDTKLSKP